MSLRQKILLPILLLGLAVAGLLGESALVGWDTLRQARLERRIEAIQSALFDAAVALAVERGTVNGLLANPAAATPDRRQAAAHARTTAEIGRAHV